jgi:beta-phosphoglucomutase
VIRAVIFDLDGVLVDATEWHRSALNLALGLFGYTITRYEHVRMYNGLPTRVKLETLSVEKGFPRALHELVGRIKQTFVREQIVMNCRPAFEKELMVRNLRRDGYALAVCSNSIRDTAELMIRSAGLHEYFDVVLTNEDVSRPKPDPEMYLTACRRLGISPNEAAVVEDAPHGVQAARQAGTHVCVVTGHGEVDYHRVRRFIEQLERRVAVGA